MSFSSREINALVVLLGESPSQIADAISEDLTAVSRNLNLKRKTPRIREKIARHLADKVAVVIKDTPIEAAF